MGGGGEGCLGSKLYMELLHIIFGLCVEEGGGRK